MSHVQTPDMSSGWIPKKFPLYLLDQPLSPPVKPRIHAEVWTSANLRASVEPGSLKGSPGEPSAWAPEHTSGVERAKRSPGLASGISG